MVRSIGALLVGLSTAALALGHALYLVPGTDAKVLVVFGDQLFSDAPMKEATLKKLEGLKLTARDAARKATPVASTKEKDQLSATVPAGTTVVFGQVEYGLFAKGDAAPMLIKYYPKAVIGSIPADGAALGDKAEVDIVPKAEGNKVRFQVQARGKPVAGATVVVIVPGRKEEVQEKTDEKGWTKEFEGAGKYGATYRQVEKTNGEREGKKYEGVSHTATLVVELK